MSDGLQSAAFSPTVCKWCSLAFIQGHKTCAQALKKWKSPRMRWKWDRTELLRFYSMNKFRWLAWQLVWVEVEQNRWVKPVQQNLCLPPNTEYPPHPKHTVPIPTAPFCADTEDEHVDINHCSSSTSQHPHPPAGPFCSCPPPQAQRLQSQPLLLLWMRQQGPAELVQVLISGWLPLFSHWNVQKGWGLRAKAPGICPEANQYNAWCFKP